MIRAIRRGATRAEPGEVIEMVFGPPLRVHERTRCAGRPCCIHDPSNHHMRDWPMVWRGDIGVMERMCEHGIGHPDPDDLAHRRAKYGTTHGLDLHGCDGCCSDPTGEHR